MSLIFAVFTIATVLGVMLIIIGIAGGSGESYRGDFWIGVGITGGGIIACCAIFWLIAICHLPAAHYSETKCANYAERTERVTKFARYTYWDWDCLVETDEGWIPTSQLYVDEGPGR